MLSALRRWAVTIANTEPAGAGQLVGALVTLTAVLGLQLDADQTLGVVLAVQTIVALVVRAAVWSHDTHQTEVDAAFLRGVEVGAQSVTARRTGPQ